MQETPGLDNKTRAGTKTRAGMKTIPMIFVGLLTVLATPVRSEDDFSVLGFNCSSPTNIRVYDMELHCDFVQEIIGENQKVKILQHFATKELLGFKC